MDRYNPSRVSVTVLALVLVASGEGLAVSIERSHAANATASEYTR
jgi:hypothetical protein